MPFDVVTDASSLKSRNRNMRGMLVKYVASFKTCRFWPFVVAKGHGCLNQGVKRYCGDSLRTCIGGPVEISEKGYGVT